LDAVEGNRARAFAAIDIMLGTAQRAHEDAAIGQSELFGGAAAPAPIVLPAVEPWLAAERLQREYEAVGFFLSGHPLDDYAAALKRLRVQSWAEFSRAVKAGASAGRVAGTVVARTERRTKNGSKMGIIGLSDPSGHYEAVLFAEGLAQYRDLLEPGKAVLLFLTAEVQGDEVRARIQSVESLDEAAAKAQKGLRVFLRDDAPIEGVAKRLEPIRLSAGRNGGEGGGVGGDGEVSVVLMLGNGNEVEVKLPGRFKVSPQIAGAIKAVSGVVTVEAL
jgi:DNA polymerase-3 subunit alpha